MELKWEAEDSHQVNEPKLPLLQDMPVETENTTLIQKAIRQTFQSTAHLANLLPTGTVLAFQLLSPILSNQGKCDPMDKIFTTVLVSLCGLSCFILSFTDSFVDRNGDICYGFATFKGLWVIDGSAKLPPEVAESYRLKFIDFVHGFMSLSVFVAVALFNQNVVSCFYTAPSVQVREMLTSLPVGIGAVCSMLFVMFPATRRGIGFPLYAN